MRENKFQSRLIKEIKELLQWTKDNKLKIKNIFGKMNNSSKKNYEKEENKNNNVEQNEKNKNEKFGIELSNTLNEIITKNNKKEENKRKEKEDINNNTNNKEEKKSKYDGLNDEELKKIRDKLLVERSNITNLYNKIPIKVNKMEQIKKREESEKKIAQINNDLMQIRLKLKGNI